MSSVLLLNVSLDVPTCDQSSVYTALWPLSPTHLLSPDFCFVFPFSRFYGMFAFVFNHFQDLLITLFLFKSKQSEKKMIPALVLINMNIPELQGDGSFNVAKMDVVGFSVFDNLLQGAV